MIIKYATTEQADARSEELWDSVKGNGWQPGNVTTRLYGTRTRTGDAESDADLPDGIDAALVISERDEALDKLLAESVVTAGEAVAVAKLYPAWETGIAYNDDDIVTYNGDVYVIRQPHTSQADWTPPQVLALYMVYRANAETLLPWIQSEKVAVGWQRTFDGKTYAAIQPHVTQSDWTPPAVPALWSLVTPPTAEWAYPVAYKVGDVVTYQGREYRCRQAHTSISTWTPAAVLALWLPL